MDSNPIQKDEPLTPTGKLFLRPEMNVVINCALAGENPIDVEAVKAVISNSILVQHPRFCSLLVKDSCGREHWRKTKVNVDQHVIILDEPLNGDDESAVNDYLADLSVSCPLDMNKPLWEVHLLMAHKCAVFRVHHALGDGISLMSMFLTLCRRVDDPSQFPMINGVGGSGSGGGNRRRRSVWSVMKMLWFTIVAMLQFVMRSLWLKDKPTVLSGGDGVELWPRKLVTAKFRIDDMKMVKRAIADATINDVLFGVVSYGISKYLNLQSSKALQDGLQVTGLAMVNLRPQTGLQDLAKLMEKKSKTRWGNKFGILLLPVYYHKGGGVDPLQFVRRAKKMVDKKKNSLEAFCSYKIASFLMSCFGVKFASLLNYRIMSNVTFSISNVIGPQEDITIVGNPIKFIRVNLTSLPHAITMHMVSYAGRADMQILVAKDIIQDPEVLAKCFEDALIEMKEVVAELKVVTKVIDLTF